MEWSKGWIVLNAFVIKIIGVILYMVFFLCSIITEKLLVKYYNYYKNHKWHILFDSNQHNARTRQYTPVLT